MPCSARSARTAWPWRGAIFTGVDFLPPALAVARQAATELRLAANFIDAAVYAAPEAWPQPGGFDMVHTSWGTIC